MNEYVERIKKDLETDDMKIVKIEDCDYFIQIIADTTATAFTPPFHYTLGGFVKYPNKIRLVISVRKEKLK